MFNSDQDSVLAELSRTRAAYEDAIEPSERTQLRSRLDELRSDGSQLEGSGLAALSWQELHDRVRRVRHRLDELASRRIEGTMASASSEAGGGIDPVALLATNRQVDEVDGRAELTHELALLLEEVERRRGPEPG